MKTISLYLALALLFPACHPSNENEDAQMQVAYDMSPAPPAASEPSESGMIEMVKFSAPVIKDDAVEEEESIQEPPAGARGASEKKIIKDGNLAIRVKEANSAKKNMDSLVRSAGGYYEQEEMNNFENRSSYTLKIRIPSAGFETFLKTAEKGAGEVTYKSINTRDVTEEYRDTETRLGTKRLFRKRYHELLTKAGKVEDMLAIQENIRNLQEEIESQEGRLKYLDDQVAFSTLEMRLFTDNEKAEAKEIEPGFSQRVKDSFQNGWASVIAFVMWGIRQWPWILLTLLVGLMAWKRFSKKRKKA